MDRIVVNDDFLYRHMPKFEEKLLCAYPEEEEITHEFSAKFEQSMKKLIRRVRQKESYGIPVTTGKRLVASIVAAFVGALVIASNTKALNMEIIKEKLYKYTQVIYDTFTEKRYSAPEDKVGEFVPMYPEYVPEGYELAIEEVDETYLILSYEKSDSDGFIVQEDQIQDGMVVSDDNEYIREEETEILGYKAIISYKDNGSIHIRWESESTLYLVAANNLEKDELVHICESLKAK